MPLYVRCGFAWEAAELYWLRRFLSRIRSPRLDLLRVIDMPIHSLYGAHWALTGRGIPAAGSSDGAVYLPGRNVLLVSQAAVVCAQRRISTIVLGILRGNPFGDASPKCLSYLGRSLSLALRHPIKIITPFRQARKVSLMRSSQRLPIHLTFSCLRPNGRLHCGRCNKCAERMRAFRQAGLSDPTHYAG